MIELSFDNIIVQFKGCLFRQAVGIPVGTNCAPLLADFFLYSNGNVFLDNMIRNGNRRLDKSFDLCYRYIDDLIVFNNKWFLDYLKEIYLSQLTVERANKSDHLANFFDLTFIIDSGSKLSTRHYEKRDDFDFHIVNFLFLSSNIPSGLSYGVYISQLISTYDAAHIMIIVQVIPWRSGYCYLNNGEYNLNQSKDDSFVERLAKNNS